MRLRLRRGHRRQAVPRHRSRRPDRPGQSRAPRRHRLREEHRRRRRPDHPDPPPLPFRRGGEIGRAAPRQGRLRRRHGLPAPGPCQPRRVLPLDRAGHSGRGASFPRLARGSNRECEPRQQCEGRPAAHPPGLHRPPGEPGRGPGLRAQAVHRQAPDRKGGLPLVHPVARRLLHPVSELSHDRLQRHAQRLAATGVLPGPGRRARRERHRDGPLALLHKHLPIVAASPSVPLHLAQR